MKTIPTKINKYNVYNTGNRLLGMGDEVTLPSFEASSETVSGAGVLGEFDDPTVGYFSNMELEIPFRVLDQEAVDMLDQTKATQLELRGGQQTTNSVGDIEFRPMRVVVRGRNTRCSIVIPFCCDCCCSLLQSDFNARRQKTEVSISSSVSSQRLTLIGIKKG